MSYNLAITVEAKGGGYANLLLPGFGRGITHSAFIAVGDKISFPGDVVVKIKEIRHYWENAGSSRAPTSLAIGTVKKPVSESQFAELESAGFVLDA